MRASGWLLLASLLPAGGSADTAADVPDAQRQQELHDILIQDCGSCHGLRLRGGLGPALLPQTLAGKPRALLVETVRNGRPGTAMPPWGPFFNTAEINWLVDQLLTGRAIADSTQGN